MKIFVMKGIYAVCKLKSVPELSRKGFLSLTITPDEISLVCEQALLPEDTSETQRDFSLLRVEGPLDFSLIGILSELSGILAEEGISIFCVSTYETDYIMVRINDFARAKAALEKRGHVVDSNAFDSCG